MTKKPRAAIYMRVSTEEQTLENQLPDIKRIATFHRLNVVATWGERKSVGKVRPEFEKMLAAARNHEFDVLLLWAIDRLGRSMIGNLNCMLELDQLGIRILSHREPWLDTGGPIRPLLIAIFSWVAEQERNQIIERTKAGMARARELGHPNGHPPTEFTKAQLKRIMTLNERGRSVRYIGKKMKVNSSTIWRTIRRTKLGRRYARTLFPNDNDCKFITPPKPPKAANG